MFDFSPGQPHRLASARLFLSWGATARLCPQATFLLMRFALSLASIGVVRRPGSFPRHCPREHYPTTTLSAHQREFSRDFFEPLGDRLEGPETARAGVSVEPGLLLAPEAFEMNAAMRVFETDAFS